MVSLIATVYNERDNINPWIDSLLTQSRTPDEIVIVDGGSSDGTWDILQERARSTPTLVVQQDKGNISHGRNAAVRIARYEAIVVTDAGCVYDHTWFSQIASLIEKDDVFFAATAFGPYLEKTDACKLFLLAAATTPSSDEFKNKQWLPSSRSVAFKKSVWEQAGGYPEWIPICEDVIFDLIIQKNGVQTYYIRKPLVFWRPRPTFSAFLKQLFKYARSDGHGKLWPLRQATRYGVYGLSILLIAIALVSGSWWPAIPLVVGAPVYMKKFWKRWSVFSRLLPWHKRIVGYGVLPIIIAFGDVAKMCGWPAGVWDRKTGKIHFTSY